MAKYSTQPSEKRWYDVIRWNELTHKWDPIDRYPTEDQAKEQAQILNDEYDEEIKQLQQNN